jgi:DNA-binding transcriptional ArsR family regulator
MAVDLIDRSEVLKALAEPTRWRIVELLACEQLCGCHLVEDLGVAQPLVSHHLKVLRDAGIVEGERFKQWTYYRVRPEALAAIRDDLARLGTSCRTDERRPCC